MMSSGIGNFLRQNRQNNNLSRESFAEMLDISVAFLAAIELGTKKPAYDTLIKITSGSQRQGAAPATPFRSRPSLVPW